ncbi:sulfotransferase [Spirulina sp. CCNP1310]|uniref:sulfotransferase n=1 Tax=Spirulina sp. CCNP1310 TaxID=3110249 RepID=UPI002B1F89F5|nr:sulfotransferase [Spirulina sp. CCNP1310]MEA5420879.1 sulfotransferase [Spirulina sp. CCNP1310]
MQHPQSRINQRVCCIAGTGHSGSTLLGLLLGNHSTSFFCGEGNKSQYIGKENAPARKRFCKFCGPDCPIWGQLVLNPEQDLYEQLAQRIWEKQHQEKTLMIDSTSGSYWIRQQWQQLEQTAAQPYLVFLQRDGRGVVNSYRRKYPQRDFIEIIQDWLDNIHKAQTLFNEFNGPKIIIHYEDLAVNTHGVLKSLCEFLEIAYEPEMINFGNSEYHVLGGNNGTQYLVAQSQANAQDRFLGRMSDPNRQYYQSHNAEIVLDVRWQTELSEEQKEIFANLAGEINQSFEWNS